MLLVLAAAVAVSCDGESPQSIDVSGPLENFPPCNAPGPGRKPVEGLVVPEGAVIEKVRTRGPTENVQGFIPLTPVQVRMDYERRSDIQVLAIEDEIYEAEVLVTDGEYRTFIKAEAVCDRGSEFTAVVASELEAGQVPTPAGGVTPPP